MHLIDDAREGATNLLLNVIGFKPESSVLLVSNPEVDPLIPRLFSEIVQEHRGNTVVLTCNQVRMSEEYPRPVEAAMLSADLLLAITNFHPSFFRTKGAWRATYEFGIRTLHVDPPHLSGLATAGRANCQLVASIARRLLRKFEEGKTLRITSESGTQLTFETKLGLINAQDHFPLRAATAPHGVFAPHPVRGSVNGTIFFDAIDGFAGLCERPLGLVVEGNIIRQVMGGREASYLKSMLEKFAGSNFIGEFGFGINPAVPLMDLLQFEWHEVCNRSAGVLHSGVGASFMAPSEFHRHLLLIKPTVELVETGETIIEAGKLVILELPEIRSLMK